MCDSMCTLTLNYTLGLISHPLGDAVEIILHLKGSAVSFIISNKKHIELRMNCVLVLLNEKVALFLSAYLTLNIFTLKCPLTVIKLLSFELIDDYYHICVYSKWH